MTGPDRLQARPRGVAAITALVFLVCGLLAMHHEASTLHVRDAAGGYAHAPRMTGHHRDTGQSDMHGQRHADGEAGECTLLTTFHQATSHAHAAPAVAVAAVTTVAPALAPPARDLRAADVYRLAPKTSPPAAA